MGPDPTTSRSQEFERWCLVPGHAARFLSIQLGSESCCVSLKAAVVLWLSIIFKRRVPGQGRRVPSYLASRLSFFATCRVEEFLLV
jgi:hypothetical protein